MSDPSALENPLVYSGANFRSYLRAVTALGYADAVRPLISAQTRDLMADPPHRWEWSERATKGVIELIDGVAQYASDVEARRLGRTVMSDSIGEFLKPVFRTLISVANASPPRLIRELPLLSRSFIRGVRFEAKELAPSSWQIEIHNGSPVPRSTLVAWAGVLSFLDELMPLEVSVVLGNSGSTDRIGHYLMEWRPR